MSQPLSVRVTDEADVESRLIELIGCAGAAGGRSAQRDRVIADYLRHHLCHLIQPEQRGESAAAVHIHRLLAAVRQQLGAWLPENEAADWTDKADDGDAREPEESLALSDLGMRLLRRLVFLKEAAPCGNGFYLPAPVRVVPLPSGSALALGGLPTRSLARQVQVPLVWAGTCRVVREALCQVPLNLPRQPINVWMGLPGENLADWTQSLLADAVENLIPSASDADRMQFEVYGPTIRRKQDQRNRWLAPGEWRGSSAELSLCRTVARPYRFWLAPLDASRRGASFRREAPVPAALARRLMYGLDQRSGAPAKARIDFVPHYLQERELRLYSWPAWEELRLLQALAADVTPFQKQNLPLCYRFSLAWWPDVRWALDNLGLQVEGAIPA
jgi:hypothetical protein